jgi:pimeloyl-ACP methyl ester carboxylesterase
MKPAPQLAPHGHPISLAHPRGLVHVFEAGPTDKPAVLLIHGLQDEADTWRHIFEPLAQSHRVIALDLPGFGRSDKAKRAYGVPFYADVVLAVMDALHIAYATLIGNSMGAMIAETIALTHPARVLKLVLVDGTIRLVKTVPTPMSTPLGLLTAPRRDKAYFEKLRQSPGEAFDSLLPFYGNMNALSKEDRDFLYQRVNERVWDEPQRRVSLALQMGFPLFFMGRAPSLLARIPGLAIPTHVIWGEHDRIFPIVNGRERAVAQPNTTFHEIKDAGHLPHQEKPEAFLRALLEFWR